MKAYLTIIVEHAESLFMIFGGLWLFCYIVKNWIFLTKTKPLKPFYLYGTIAASICSIYLGVFIILRAIHVVLPNATP